MTGSGLVMDDVGFGVGSTSPMISLSVDDSSVYLS